ncbi:hypothetical protein BH09SUM1_BH09SUM1_20910 [soil metagenome]
MKRNSKIQMQIGFSLIAVLFATMCVYRQSSSGKEFIQGWMTEREGAYRMNLRLASKIMDEAGRPLDDVSINFVEMTAGGSEVSAAEENFRTSKAVNREWRGIMGVDVELSKPGYRSSKLQFIKPKPSGEGTPSSPMRSEGKWFVHDEDIVLRKRQAPAAPNLPPLRSLSLLNIAYRRDGTWSFVTNPQEGTKKPNRSQTTETLQIDNPPPYVHLDFIPAPSVERIFFDRSSRSYLLVSEGLATGYFTRGRR